MSKNRDYQSTHIEQIIEKVSTKRKVIGQAATGHGKTQEFVSISQRYIAAYGKSVLVLVHREELMEQARKRFKKVANIDATLITSKTNSYRMARVYIGMVESTVKRLDCFSNVGLVIIDECHIANFNKVHSIFTDELIIGFTATPISSNKHEPLNKFYNDIVPGPQIKELIGLGWLAQNFTLCPQDVVDSSKLEIDNRKGDYNENKMAAEFKKPKYILNVVKAYRKWCLGKKTLIFNVNIEHSQEVCQAFNDFGYECRHIDSNNIEERRANLKWFKETKNAILCNVGIATTGFDEPTVERIVTNFCSLSLNKCIQCWGRGSRIVDQDFIDEFQDQYPYPLEIKDTFGIIDMGGNCMSHGFGDWNDDRDWKMLFENPDIPGEGVAPKKTCPVCEGLVHAAKNVCDCYEQPMVKDENGEWKLCGHVFDRKKAKEESDIGEMILITRGLDIEELVEKNKLKYDFFTFEQMAEKVVSKIFVEKISPSDETLNKGFTYYYHLCCNWWMKYMANKNYIQNISNSQWHIDKARHCYANAIEKYRKKYDKFNSDKCRYCSNPAVLRCNDCDFPVCEDHSTNGLCIHDAQLHHVVSR